MTTNDYYCLQIDAARCSDNVALIYGVLPAVSSLPFVLRLVQCSVTLTVTVTVTVLGADTDPDLDPPLPRAAALPATCLIYPHSG